jgi:7,8-dihydro-6-hydroxymethylpterin-pyrophosphokinase
VLAPLLELAPDLIVPGRGRVSALLAELQSSP